MVSGQNVDPPGSGSCRDRAEVPLKIAACSGLSSSTQRLRRIAADSGDHAEGLGTYRRMSRNIATTWLATNIDFGNRRGHHLTA
jgi:hypothetical protein